MCRMWERFEIKAIITTGPHSTISSSSKSFISSSTTTPNGGQSFGLGFVALWMCYFVLLLDARRLEEPQIARKDRQLNLKLEQFDTNRASYEIILPPVVQQTTTREIIRTSAKRVCKICAIILNFIHERMAGTKLRSGDNVGCDVIFDGGKA